MIKKVKAGMRKELGLKMLKKHLSIMAFLKEKEE
jgi:hypothetical protein